MVLSMLLNYSSCNTHLILKSFVGLMYIKVVSSISVDSRVEYHTVNDANLDGSPSGRKGGGSTMRGEEAWNLISPMDELIFKEIWN